MPSEDEILLGVYRGEVTEVVYRVLRQMRKPGQGFTREALDEVLAKVGLSLVVSEVRPTHRNVESCHVVGGVEIAREGWEMEFPSRSESYTADALSKLRCERCYQDMIDVRCLTCNVVNLRVIVLEVELEFGDLTNRRHFGFIDGLYGSVGCRVADTGSTVLEVSGEVCLKQMSMYRRRWSARVSS